jgi:hypothetical protein
LQAFLVYIHNTFNKPWERYSLHLHLDNTVCDGRVSPSEWEAGAYFETEFILEDRLVLYVHFEEVERRKLDFNVEEESAACRWGSDGTKEHQDKVRKMRHSQYHLLTVSSGMASKWRNWTTKITKSGGTILTRPSRRSS